MFGITPPSQNPFSFDTFTRFSSFAPHLLMSPKVHIYNYFKKSDARFLASRKIYSHTRFLASNINTMFPSIHSILKAFTPLIYLNGKWSTASSQGPPGVSRGLQPSRALRCLQGSSLQKLQEPGPCKTSKGFQKPPEPPKPHNLGVPRLEASKIGGSRAFKRPPGLQGPGTGAFRPKP